MRLLKPDGSDLAAVPRVPAQGRSPELARLIDQEQDELECVRQTDKIQLGRRREGDRRVPSVRCPNVRTQGRSIIARVSGPSSKRMRPSSKRMTPVLEIRVSVSSVLSPSSKLS